MICPECRVEFRGNKFYCTSPSLRDKGYFRRCPNGHEFREPPKKIMALKYTRAELQQLESVLDTYCDLHRNKIFSRWLWVAIERVVAGEPEAEVMKDYGYVKNS